MAFNDWDGDGKNTFADDFIEYQIYKDTTEENDDFKPQIKPINSQVETPKGKFEKRYHTVLIAVFAFLALGAPIYTIIGLKDDPEYFFGDFAGVLLAVITVLEVIALIVFICYKIKKRWFNNRHK